MTASIYFGKNLNLICIAMKSSRLFSTSAVNFFQIKNVTVVGAGIMGSGIAQIAAQSGFHVNLVDKNDQILEKSKNSIQKSLKRICRRKFPDDAKAEKLFTDETLNRITMSSGKLANCVKNADLIIESVSENADLKKQVFKELDAHAPSSALFTTNTSSVPLSELASVVDRRKEKFAGLHFFNPVQVMKLLELVKTSNTSQETFDTLQEFGKKLGKTVVLCQKDTPGFIVNRLLVPYCFEAFRMLERGDASMPDIDTAMRLGAGYPMGPFELTDYIGLDTMNSIMDGWHKKFPDHPLFKPSPVIKQLVESGKFGRKSGEGFYKYP